MDRLEKNKRIAESFKETKLKRQSQLCKVIRCKIQKNKLNKKQLEQIKMLFVESKWVYNYLLADGFESINSKNLKEVVHYTKDGEKVTTELNYLGSSIKDQLIKAIKNSIKGLSALKKKGYKVGKLKFKSEYNSIDFKQYGITHKIVSNHRIRLQSIKGNVYVNGLEQLKTYEPIGYDIANCKLLNINDDYYVTITIFVDREKYYNLIDKTNRNVNKENVIGIDFGCKTNFTLSNGEKYNATFEETERLKHLQKKLNRQQKGSNNSRRTIRLIKKEYQKITNRKDDLSNKFINFLFSNYENVVIQDEQLSNWHKGRFGKTVQHSIMGRVKAKLIKDSRTFVINRFVPTSKICLECGHVFNDLKLSDRTVACSECGCVEDRDVHAAKNMVWYFENKDKIGVERTKFKRLDFDKALSQIFKVYDREHQRLKNEDSTASAVN